jgi:muramidase (phage lysozyme)
LLFLCLCGLSRPVTAEAVSLLVATPQDAQRGSLFQASLPKQDGATSSLFIGRVGNSFFADRPTHEPAYADATANAEGGPDVIQIRDLIGQAESRRDGYDAVQHGAKVRPEKRPTEMTIREIYAWIKDTPRQPHAIGRYQFIPATLKRLVNVLGLPPDTRFTPAVQDRLGDVLLAEAGLHDFREGKLSRRAFMNNLAKIWAGLPNDTGKSHYDGYAGNKASMTWSRFEAEMSRIFPS